MKDIHCFLLPIQCPISSLPPLPLALASHREFKEPDGTIREERRYSYTTAWRGDLVKSNNFDDARYHHNPRSMPVGNMEWTADKTNVGLYELSRDAVAEIGDFQPLHPSTVAVGGSRESVTVYGDMMYSGNPQRPEVCV